MLSQFKEQFYTLQQTLLLQQQMLQQQLMVNGQQLRQNGQINGTGIVLVTMSLPLSNIRRLEGMMISHSDMKPE